MLGMFKILENEVCMRTAEMVKGRRHSRYIFPFYSAHVGKGES